MAKKKKEKKEDKISFDYKKYIDDEIKDKDFLYYILSNGIILKDEEDTEDVYKKFLNGGIR